MEKTSLVRNADQHSVLTLIVNWNYYKENGNELCRKFWFEGDKIENSRMGSSFSLLSYVILHRQGQ